MERLLEFRTIGFDDECDLSIPVEELGGVHARLALRADGGLLLLDAGHEGGTSVDRGAGWQRIKKLRLCSGDRICVSDVELPLDALTGMFSGTVKPTGRKSARSAPLRVSKPKAGRSRRNPGTGQIESNPDGELPS